MSKSYLMLVTSILVTTLACKTQEKSSSSIKDEDQVASTEDPSSGESETNSDSEQDLVYGETFGEIGGKGFDDGAYLKTVSPSDWDVKSLFMSIASQVAYSGALYVGGVCIKYKDKEICHGIGKNGRPNESYDLKDGEYIKELVVGVGKACASRGFLYCKKYRRRVTYLKFITNKDEFYGGDEIQKDVKNFPAPEGMKIVGLHGLSGEELDKIGPIFAPK